MLQGFIARFKRWLGGKPSPRQVSQAKQTAVAPATRPAKPPEPEAQPPKRPLLTEQQLRDSESLFYDLMFGKVALQSDSAALEQQILENLEVALNNVDMIAAEVVQLPALLAQIDRELRNPEYEASRLARLIEQDPIIAANVLKLANAPAYKPVGQEITNLQQGIAYLGGQTIHQLVVTVAMQKLADTPKIYFRLFGQQIWAHSLQVAQIAKELAPAQGVDPFSAYFTGLVHDIGKIAIFKILVNSLRQSHPDLKPNSNLFREALTENSLKLSYLIAKCWQLPDSVVVTLQQQVEYKKARKQDAMAELLYQANLYSEFAMVEQAGLVSREFLEQLCDARDLDITLFDQFKALKEAA